MRPLEAHLRLLSTLPRERIRTIEARPLPPALPGGARTKRRTLELHAAIMARHRIGMSSMEIAEELNTTASTVGRHINGQILTVREAHGRRL